MRKYLLAAVTLLCGCSEDHPTNPSDPTPFVIDSPEKIIEGIERAYESRDHVLYARLLAQDPDRNAGFVFELERPTAGGDTQWDDGTELRIHRRMFDPESALEPLIPQELWLQSASVELTLLSDWTERDEFYSADAGADGLLDPQTWRVVSRRYEYANFFALQGEIDYLATGEAVFTVIEDLGKSGSDEGRFLLWRWEDFVPATTRRSQAAEYVSWSTIKNVYHPGEAGPEPASDFALPDVNATSPRYDDLVSPRDYLQKVSGWYFGHAT